MKQTIEGWIYAEKWSFEEEPSYTFFRGGRADNLGCELRTVMPLMQYVIEFDAPENIDKDLTVEAIRNLREQKQILLAETQLKVAKIEDAIAKLSCIEHKDEGVLL